MSITAPPSEQRLLLHDVPWRTYERLLRAFVDRPGVRLTFDRGTFELMTLSHEHEHDAYLLARLVDALTEELALPVKLRGQMDENAIVRQFRAWVRQRFNSGSSGPSVP